MNEQWWCGDCGRKWPATKLHCDYPFDDYLGLHRVKTIDQAMNKRIAPILAEFDRAIRKKQRKPFEWITK